MSVPKVRIHIRAVLHDGSRQFLDPVELANHTLRKGWAVYQGTAQRFDDFTYYLRYLRNGKRVWESVGDDPALAQTAKRRTEVRLSAAAEGVALQGAEPAKHEESQPVSARSLRKSIDEYLSEIREHKSRKTLAAYTKTLRFFEDSLGKRAEKMTIEDVSRADALAFATFLRKRSNKPRTVRNRIDYLQTFLHHHGLPSVLVGHDKPKYTEKKVRCYNAHELGLMFAHATEDEADLLHFMLGTGTREQEVQYACWSDVDLVAKTHTVTEHLDLGFIPKDKEEGTLQLPDALVERLKTRRKKHSKDRLLFPTANGTPNGHLLRIVKSLALRAGANCGHCFTTKGLSCAEHPVCRHVILHKLRKTYATTLHRGGISARTIQGYLRHSDLETTLRYLADGEDEQTLGRINSAFDSLFKSAQAVQAGGAA
jgi:integrase/recombinase XerD